jgi:hypothetical protein
VKDLEQKLAQWESAGIIGAETSAAIRAYELAEAKPAGRQWQVLLALILGGILLGAGVLLFVAAHWDAVGPGSRLALVLGILIFFHGLGLLTRGRFAGFATAMHAFGTVGCGAAIALIGQIFNMQEHWPAAILVWGLCAAAGWWLLGDQFQQTLTLLLLPAWVLSEFSYQLQPYRGEWVYLLRVMAVLGAFYLVSFAGSKRRVVFGILFAVGAVGLMGSVIGLGDSWRNAAYGYFHQAGFVPLGYRVATLGLIALIVAAGVLLSRWNALLIVLVAGLGYALPWASTTVTEDGWNGGRGYTHSDASVLAYLMVAAVTIAFVGWGVRTASKALVNYGVAMFAVTVIWFYFSSVMDKLGRSFGLIVLGVLFLAGGWALERTRRELVRRMEPGNAGGAA